MSTHPMPEKKRLRTLPSTIASSGQPPYDEDMEKRMDIMETDLDTIKLDLGIVKANGATKSDIADTKALVSEAKTSVILWVVSAVILAQLLPSLLKLFAQ